MHGWPSFRDEEVNWDVVRVLSDGETVSIDGTHLGHNIPDKYVGFTCPTYVFMRDIKPNAHIQLFFYPQSIERATDTASI